MKVKIKKALSENELGFTLIELLITIFIVSVGLIGVISFFNSSLQSQFDAKNEVIAAGLAQEETEIIRNIVDYNFLNGNAWYNSLCNNATCNNSDKCRAVDYTDLTDHQGKSCSNRAEVCIDDTTNQYYQCNDKNALFSRSADIDIDSTSSGSDLDNGRCLQITATVGWPNTDSNCNSDITKCPYKTISTDIICKPRI